MTPVDRGEGTLIMDPRSARTTERREAVPRVGKDRGQGCGILVPATGGRGGGRRANVNFDVRVGAAFRPDVPAPRFQDSSQENTECSHTRYRS